MTRKGRAYLGTGPKIFGYNRRDRPTARGDSRWETGGHRTAATHWLPTQAETRSEEDGLSKKRKKEMRRAKYHGHQILP